MKRKLTFTIRTEVLETFNMAIKSAGLRRDSYLNHVLPNEIDELLPLEPNSEKGEKQLRDLRRFLHKDFSKMNVALDEEVAEKLDQVCREKKIPYFGICMGLQVAVIEFARNVCSLEKANSLELDSETPHPVISLMENQKNVKEKGGTMRLGNYPCRLLSDFKAKNVYGRKVIKERHRHRFEFNNDYKKLLEENGLKSSGICPDNNLVEIIELDNHPWHVSCQFHPEFKSSPIAPHPLFNGFIQSVMKYKGL